MRLASALNGKAHEPQADVEFSRAQSEREIAYVWDTILPQVERALQSGQGDGTTPDVMLGQIAKGDMQLWVAHEGSTVLAGVVVSLKVYATGTKLHVQVIAGRDMRRWMPALLELLRDLKELVGAQCVEASCRPGLVKYLQQLGCRRKAVIMELGDV